MGEHRDGCAAQARAVTLTSRPLVSVVVPTHNGQRFIVDTLASLLAQTHSQLEILVVDDGSTDATPDLVGKIRDARLKQLSQPNGGVSSARNAGTAQAQGAFIAFCDQDDIWHPRKLELQLAALAAMPEAGVSCTGYRFWHPSVHGQYPEPDSLLSDANGSSLDQAQSGWVYHLMLLESCVLTSTALVHRQQAKVIGEWDTVLEYGEDWDFWLRASRLTQFAFLAAPLVAYRQNISQGSRKPRSQNWSEKVLQRAINRWGMAGPDGRSPDPRAFRRRRAIDWQGFGAQHLSNGNTQLARTALWKAIQLDPINRGHWQLLARTWMPRR